MHIIKLNAIDSTNSYLRELASKKRLEDFTVVIAKHQTKGKGQIGAVWNSEKDKNLTCSVFKRNCCVSIDDAFYISMVTSLAIIKTLQQFQVPKLVVKWPNDILAEQKKICGILIENVIKQQNIEGSIIGIGLNVNQTQFSNLPLASSLKNLTGTLFDVEEMLTRIVEQLQYYFDKLEKGKHDFIKRAYEALLFRRHKPSTFKDLEGQLFSGFIQGVNNNGTLQILLEDGIIKEFELKEIQLLY
ncbi:biotin--[acetyl-CoA-carboxylase] ligase [Flavobacteriaceae bacterium S0825]|uniref:biotin--[acetyl-CoA-carboxylase] ligase n=1 Tax=Gaetbulibacter sp. S0825 TaxID=2720084 RepID=UPI00142F43EA|nr:biotin--[acetyl-CoA-carboxylase] ligase [Gaetbulibacter sp. S0825]MCK0110235.1 biotin--[acetyl-CoA-carboxylase] ligase [Flavobacteriaceae bacterium S0825]NIX65864.1 biotin--[acetyl-CoA-carboxylase] ligase [Gaetbulibacter sp. S0825]